MSTAAEPGAPEAVPNASASRRLRRVWRAVRPRAGRRWRLQVYFVALVALFVLVAAGAALYVRAQGSEDARADAKSNAEFAAQTAAMQLSATITTLRASVAGVAANPQIAQAFSSPAGCSLAYTPYGPADRGHIDLIASSGEVVCTSRSRSHSGLGSYAGQPWLRRAAIRSAFVAPVRDVITGHQAAINAQQVAGGGFVAGFVDLQSLGPYLASVYGGGRPVEFLIATGQSGTIVARSIDARHWVGRSLTGTDFARNAGATERRDVNGTVRLYQGAPARRTGWQVFVGEDKAAVLARQAHLENRQLVIIGAGLGVVLLVAFFAYRRVALPIARLGATVRSAGDAGAMELVPVPKRSPAELAALTADVNTLIDSVNHELLERERAESQARHSEETYRLLFESHPAPMWVYEPDTLRFLAVNDTAVLTYGYTREEFLAMTIEEIRPPEDRAALHALIDEPRGFVRAGVWRHLTKDGSQIEVFITSNEIEFEGRSARLVLAQDVTKERLLEEQLRQAQKMDALGSLAGGIAHDFNNIMMVVKACSALLLRRLQEPEMREDAEQIGDAADRAVGLIRQLLAFSRQQVVRPRVTDLETVIEQILALLRRLIGENIEIVCQFEEDVPPILVDVGQLEQVILNLAINARDAMPEGGTIIVGAARATLDEEYASEHLGVTPGEYAVLKFSDSGLGMDAETRSRVFEPFFTTKESGNGLGLATVYGIVNQSRGHIWLYSEPGLGTTFKIYLPSASDVPSLPKGRPAVTSVQGSETILLVEDDEAVRPLISKALTAYGYRVLEADSASAAVDLAESEQRIDVLLTDVVMPGMNGHELAARLLARRPHLKVLYTSGYASDSVLRRDVFQAGMEYIEKPFLPEEVARKIREMLAAPIPANSNG